MQDILLAVHLKRHTWDAGASFAPWLFAIARNKLVDTLRRGGRRVFVNIEDFLEIIPTEPVAETVPAGRNRTRAANVSVQDSRFMLRISRYECGEGPWVVCQGRRVIPRA